MSRSRPSNSAKLDVQQVQQIRTLCHFGFKQESIAAAYNVCKGTVVSIALRKNFAWLSDAITSLPTLPLHLAAMLRLKRNAALNDQVITQLAAWRTRLAEGCSDEAVRRYWSGQLAIEWFRNRPRLRTFNAKPGPIRKGYRKLTVEQVNQLRALYEAGFSINSIWAAMPLVCAQQTRLVCIAKSQSTLPFTPAPLPMLPPDQALKLYVGELQVWRDEQQQVIEAYKQRLAQQIDCPTERAAFIQQLTEAWKPRRKGKAPKTREVATA